MFDWFTGIDPAAQILAMIFFPLALVFATGLLAHAWKRVKKVEQRTILMEQMVKRGMAPEEIAQVLLTADLAVDSGEPIEDLDPEVRVVKHLNKCWYSGGDVERILEAARDSNGEIADTKMRIIMSMASHWNGTSKIVNVLRTKSSVEEAAAARA